jgi:hypothetical protein
MDAVPTVTDPIVPEAKDTTNEGDGSCPSLTVNVPVPPSLIVAGWAARTILIVLMSTVVIVEVADTSPAPLPVIVTDSDTALLSGVPESNTD